MLVEAVAAVAVAVSRGSGTRLLDRGMVLAEAALSLEQPPHLRRARALRLLLGRLPSAVGRLS